MYRQRLKYWNGDYISEVDQALLDVIYLYDKVPATTPLYEALTQSLRMRLSNLINVKTIMT